MASPLRETMGLPEINRPEHGPGNGEFGQDFRAGLAGVNQNMQVVAVHGAPGDHQTLDSHRQTLIKAYQTANTLGDPTKNGQVMGAVSKVQEKTSIQADAANAGYKEWQKRQPAFDAALVKIGQLEDADHPKAPAYRKLSEAIQSRADNKGYAEANSAFDQLQPKLNEVVTQPGVLARTGDGPGGGGTSGNLPGGGSVKSPVVDKGVREETPRPTTKATLEVLVIGLFKSPQREATVKISGPTSLPEVLTNDQGLARFEVDPGEYQVNAARKIATWDPGQVKTESLVAGKTFRLTLDKMNHGQVLVVVTRDGKPEVGAQVSVELSNQAPKATGNDGMIAFTLPVGSHKVTVVSADGSWTGTAQTQIAAGDSATADIKLQASGGGKDVPVVPSTTKATLEVLVIGLFKSPQREATVKISGPTSLPEVLTNDQGLARFEVDPGEYQVNAARKIATWDPGQVKTESLVAGKTFRLTLDKMNHGQVLVVVTRDGKPEVGAQVSVELSNQAPKATGNDGMIAFTLPVGSHKVTVVSADGSWTGTAQTQIAAGDSATADIKLQASGGGKAGGARSGGAGAKSQGGGEEKPAPDAKKEPAKKPPTTEEIMKAMPVVKKLEISPSNIVGNVPDVKSLVATAVLTNGTSRDVTPAVHWESSDPNIADVGKIDGSPVAILKAKGVAKITGTYSNMMVGRGQAQISITVSEAKTGDAGGNNPAPDAKKEPAKKPPTTEEIMKAMPVVKKLEIIPNKIAGKVPDIKSLEATAVLTNGTSRDVTLAVHWESSDPKIADVGTIDGRPVAVLHAKGVTKIIGTYSNMMVGRGRAEISVTVT